MSKVKSENLTHDHNSFIQTSGVTLGVFSIIMDRWSKSLLSEGTFSALFSGHQLDDETKKFKRVPNEFLELNRVHKSIKNNISVMNFVDDGLLDHPHYSLLISIDNSLFEFRLDITKSGLNVISAGKLN